MSENTQQANQTLYNDIALIIVEARATAYQSNNTILLKTYWEIGKLIIEDEQQGQTRAEYGKAILKTLALQLTLEFGKGFDERNINNIRAFALAFPIWYAVRTELSWTHYRIISRIENQQLRLQYVTHAIEGN